MRSIVGKKIVIFSALVLFLQTAAPKRAEADVIAILTFAFTTGIGGLVILGGGVWTVTKVVGPYVRDTWNVEHCTDKGAACHNFYWLACCPWMPASLVQWCLLDPEKYREKHHLHGPPPLEDQEEGSFSPENGGRTDPSGPMNLGTRNLGTVKEIQDFYKKIQTLDDNETLTLRNGEKVSIKKAKEVLQALLDQTHQNPFIRAVWQGDADDEMGVGDYNLSKGMVRAVLNNLKEENLSKGPSGLAMNKKISDDDEDADDEEEESKLKKNQNSQKKTPSKKNLKKKMDEDSASVIYTPMKRSDEEEDEHKKI